MRKIKVLIVDDSIVTQNVMQVIFQQDPEIQVIGVASNPEIANKLLEKCKPDVMTLDVDMPKMDGITYLKQLMQKNPMRVVMVSAFTEEGGAITLEALSLGAIDYVEKLKMNDASGFQRYATKLIAAVKKAAVANIQTLHPSTTTKPKIAKITYDPAFLQEQLIVIGSSTGGVEAVEKLLTSFPPEVHLPPIMMVQHIQSEFVNAFVKRINKYYDATAHEAKQGMKIEANQIYVAGQNLHLTVASHKNQYFCSLKNTPLVQEQRPSADVLFHSAATTYGKRAIGILLTGMGKDGAEGLKAIKDAGGETIAQNEETSLVWGMPGEAVRIKAASYIVPLDKIADQVLAILNKRAELYSQRPNDQDSTT